MFKRDSIFVDWCYKIWRYFRGQKPWPNLTKEPIMVDEVLYYTSDGGIIYEEHAFFPNIPPKVVTHEGWLDYDRYFVIADFIFS